MSVSPQAYAARLIRTRLRSAWEIDQALIKRDVSPDLRDQVIKELAGLKLIDDRRFARAWVATRDRLSPRGDFLLRRELQQKGVAEVYIQEALADREVNNTGAEAGGTGDEARARALAEKKLRLYAHLPKEVQFRRLAGFLERRGFSPEVVRRILFS